MHSNRGDTYTIKFQIKKKFFGHCFKRLSRMLFFFAFVLESASHCLSVVKNQQSVEAINRLVYNSILLYAHKAY
jgi:hypothetical protein